MNNPFTSDRNIFNNITKPSRQSQVKANNQIQGFRGNVNQIPSIVSNNNIKTISNRGTGNSNEGIKNDLNFRSQFRMTANNGNYNGGKIGNEGNNYQNFSISDTSESSITAHYNTLSASNNSITKNKVISDKQYPMYNGPTPANYVQQPPYNLSATTPPINSPIIITNQNNKIPITITTTNNHKIASNKNNASRGGIEKQKITFGIPDKEEANQKELKYDRNGFINQEQFMTMGSPTNFQQTSSNRQAINSDKTHRTNKPMIGQLTNKPQLLNSNQSTNIRLNNFNNLSMSPIQEVSKHKIDQSGEETIGFNIDAMGDDIDKVLASSKNQEELCRLLGIEGSAGGKGGHGQSDKGAKIKNAYYSSNNINTNYGTTNAANIKRANSLTNKNTISQNEKNNYNVNEVYNNAQNINNYPNFSKKIQNPIVQPKINYINKKYDNNNDINFNNNNEIYTTTNNYDDKDQEVFNYEAQTVNNYSSTPNPLINPNIANATNANNQKFQTKMSKTCPNTNLTAADAMTTNNIIANNNLSMMYVSELQNAIDNQMKKLSIKGKVRTFLSASQKIDTVKYNMGYI